MTLIVTWLAFVLLIFIGTKMLIDGIKESKKAKELRNPKKFSIKEVLFYGVATAIDTLGTGVALHSGTLSNNYTIFLHALTIMCIIFIFFY